MSFVLDLSDAVAGVLLADQPPHETLPRLEEIIAAYTEALERVLGVATGSLHLVDLDTLAEWLIPFTTDHAHKEEA